MPSYMELTTLLDVTIPSLSAKETLTINAQGYSGTTNYNTTGAPTTTSATPYANEVVSIEVISPTDLNGNYESLTDGGGEIWFLRNGGKSLQSIINLPVGGTVNMMPLHETVYGGRDRAVTLGEPFWKVCLDNVNPAGGVRSQSANMPTRNATLKYTGDLSVAVSSVAGFTGATNGLRIIVKGYRYTLEQLKTLGQFYTGGIYMQTASRLTQGLPALSATAAVPGFTTLTDFEKLSGGSAQQGVVVNPLWNFATNGAATQTSGPFILSQNTAISGAASGNTPDQYQDLGFPFAATSDWAIVRGLGVQVVSRSSNLQRVGWRVGGSDYPENNGGPGAGQYVSDAVNDLVFGDPGWYVPTTNSNHQAGLYEPIPRIQGDPLLIAGVSAAPFIAANGTAIPQYAVVVGINGVLVQQ